MNDFDYLIEVSGGDEASSGLFRVTREELKHRYGWSIYTSHPGRYDPVNDQNDDTHLLLRMDKTGAQRRLGHKIAVRPDQPALTQLREHRRIVKAHKDLAEQAIEAFANMRFLDLVPDRMRQAAFPRPDRIGRWRRELTNSVTRNLRRPETQRDLGGLDPRVDANGCARLRVSD